MSYGKLAIDCLRSDLGFFRDVDVQIDLMADRAIGVLGALAEL